MEAEKSGVISDDGIIEKINELGDELALVLFPGVQYYTGQLFRMEQIVSATHENGAVCGLGMSLYRPDYTRPDFKIWLMQLVTLN